MVSVSSSAHRPPFLFSVDFVASCLPEPGRRCIFMPDVPARFFLRAGRLLPGACLGTRRTSNRGWGRAQRAPRKPSLGASPTNASRRCPSAASGVGRGTSPNLDGEGNLDAASLILQPERPANLFVSWTSSPAGGRFSGCPDYVRSCTMVVVFRHTLSTDLGRLAGPLAARSDAHQDPTNTGGKPPR